MKWEDLHFFEPGDECSVVERLLPHWTQAGTLCFITWRLADSLPADVLHRLDAEIAAILESDGLSPEQDWKGQLRKRPAAERARIQWKLFATRDKFLDAGYGCCLLAKPEHASTVVDSLRHFDEDRYFLMDLVVMPNHIHFLVAFSSAEKMLAQCTSWKRFIGRKIHAVENLKGEFWQVDQFDHLVRSEREFGHYRRYIEDNPDEAGLPPGQFLHYQKQLTL